MSLNSYVCLIPKFNFSCIFLQTQTLFMEAQFDDDTFYAEIRRQILQLTSEDEDLSAEKQPFNEACVGGSTRPPPLAKYSCSWEAQSSSSSPLPVNFWKSGRGTGVFIPRVVTGKKYQRPGTDSLSISIFQL